jgi:hypothetical protein
LRPRPLGAADLALVDAALTPAERAVFDILGAADRAEAVATARRFQAVAPAGAAPVHLAAALLHDTGKAGTLAGAPARALATAAGWVVPGRWLPRRARAYLDHPRRGATRLTSAGARQEVVAWARAHHDPAAWAGSGIPPEVCEALARADGEHPERRHR